MTPRGKPPLRGIVILTGLIAVLIQNASIFYSNQILSLLLNSFQHIEKTVIVYRVIDLFIEFLLYAKHKIAHSCIMDDFFDNTLKIHRPGY